MIKPDTRHVTRYVGASFNWDGVNVVSVQYGRVSVLADKACNYSYREFWF